MNNPSNTRTGKVNGATRATAALAMIAVTLTGCGGGTRLVKDPEALQTTQPVASDCDTTH